MKVDQRNFRLKTDVSLIISKPFKITGIKWNGCIPEFKNIKPQLPKNLHWRTLPVEWTCYLILLKLLEISHICNIFIQHQSCAILHISLPITIIEHICFWKLKKLRKKKKHPHKMSNSKAIASLINSECRISQISTLTNFLRYLLR